MYLAGSLFDSLQTRFASARSIDFDFISFNNAAGCSNVGMGCSTDTPLWVKITGSML